MCGISGILNFDGKPVSADVLRAMIRMLSHRGPDASGIFVQRELGLAHTRLSIIDVAGGQQPMHSEDRSLWITFNGEIFNYLELRNDLIQKGHRFATRSDTEVILHLYQEEGQECVHKLNGQWAFAIWDNRNRTLFIARDRLGVRPLYYVNTGRAFIFGSEIKALFTHPDVDRQLDPRGLDQLFTFWVTLPPRTIFKDVNELPPGHSLTVRDGQLNVYRYWELTYNPQPHVEDSEPLARRSAETLLELLVDATRIRLRSEVPVGAYLSGGLDSSVITALVLRLTDNPVRTFSVSFVDEEFDERCYQQEVVSFLGTQHEEIRCSRGDIARDFPQVIWHAEKPLVRTAPTPLYMLSALVHRAGFKVVLTGEGADEMLGGYDIFKEMKIRKFFGSRPDSKSRALLLLRLYPYMENLRNQSPAYLKAFFHVDPAEINNPFFSHLPRWELTSKVKIFFSDALRNELAGSDVYAELEAMLPRDYARWDSFSRAQYLETAYLLPGYILSSQGDRVAMAHSVEGRFPFLDHRVVEFAAALPPDLKMKVLNEKYLLKRCAGQLVPKRIAQRSKYPVRAPAGECFFGARTPEYVEHLLSPERLRDADIFNPLAVQKLVEKFRQGRAIGTKDGMALVGILSTQLLVSQFLKPCDNKGWNHESPSRENTAVHYR
jgi:asparagine synthase (glutamine-hydrolysing)